MTDTVAGADTHRGVEAEELLARRRRLRWLGAVIALVLVAGVVLVVAALSGWGQAERHVSTFRAENQYQQAAYDSAFEMGRRVSVEGGSANTYAGACRMFANMQATSSQTDPYGGASAALSGCIDGLDAFFPGD